MQMSYWRFAAMILTSTLVMFGLMYIHTYIWDHVYFSETRAWMALLMAAAMAIIMLSYMLNMYKRRAVNLAIFVGAALTLALATWLVRSQTTISGTDYMEAMIPHHSIAILTSERAGIEDARVRKLADEIIEAQRREIAEMKYLVRALRREGGRVTPTVKPPAEVLPAGEALRTADLATSDLETMTGADLQRVIGSGPLCQFAYWSASAPVAAATIPGAGAGRGVIKLHGKLIPMTVRYAGSPGEGFVLSSDDVIVVAEPAEGSTGGNARDANARLLIAADLEVGYGGLYLCTP